MGQIYIQKICGKIKIMRYIWATLVWSLMVGLTIAVLTVVYNFGYLPGDLLVIIGLIMFVVQTIGLFAL